MILTGTTTGLDAGTATLTITDDDTAPTAVTLSLNPAAVGESATDDGYGNCLAEQLTLPTATTVTVSRTGGTATSGTDTPPTTVTTADQRDGDAVLRGPCTRVDGDPPAAPGLDRGHGDAGTTTAPTR